jgi:branched-chain amino acid:cation transporter, LIVCS family
MEKKRSMLSVTISMGLALFATQFGAGNLIFPPFLGRETGTDWIIGFLGFFVMDVGLAGLAIASVVFNKQGTSDGVVGKIGKVPGKVLLTVIMLCLGPCVCIPRTAATSYELGLKTLIPSVPLWLFGLVFFALTLVLVIRPSKVVDIIGNVLTPVLLAVMVLLIIVGIMHPVGTASTKEIVAFASGVENGYQTLDGIGGVLITLMLINAAHNSYGYKEKSDVKKLIVGADIISTILLAVVYGGLTYLGSTASAIPEFAGLDQAGLLVAITYQLLGKLGVYALAIIVVLACLTTALGLSSVVGNFFEELSGGRLKYEKIVTVLIILSYAMSNFGLEQIIAIAAPILNILYPPLIVLVLGAYVEKLSDNDHIICVGTYFALAASILDTISGSICTIGFIENLPFADMGLGWVVPALIGCGIGAFWKKDKQLFGGKSPEHAQSSTLELD